MTQQEIKNQVNSLCDNWNRNCQIRTENTVEEWLKNYILKKINKPLVIKKLFYSYFRKRLRILEVNQIGLAKDIYEVGHYGVFYNNRMLGEYEIGK